MKKITEREIVFSKLSQIDDVGRLFYWRDGVYRGINANAVQKVIDLLESGLIEKLSAHGIFPVTTVTDFVTNEFPLVIQHEKLPFVSYPFEWSFTMFQEAAELVIRISEISAKYGFGLKDCHPYNILFRGTLPVYVDLGSFERLPSRSTAITIPSFLNCYWMPLAIWASGDDFLAKRIIASAHEIMPTHSWMLYKHTATRLFTQQHIIQLSKWKAYLEELASHIVSQLSKLEALNKILAYLPAEILLKSPKLIKKKISKLNKKANRTTWGNYHSEYIHNGTIRSTCRFDRVLDIIRNLNCESAVDLAGNQGVLSFLIVSRTQVKKVICADFDCDAIEQFYKTCVETNLIPKGKLLLPAIFDLMVPEVNFYTAPPSSRFESDLVLALAVTHHLTLSQGFSFRDVIQMIASYTHKYALIEFMPMGLWDGTSSPPTPHWYTIEGFQQLFGEFFELLAVEEVETNRLLHLGRIRS
jgi:hypothetical protein